MSNVQIVVRHQINNPARAVFRAISDVANLPATNPDIISTEFHSETTDIAVGTRFREIRRMGKREMATDLEITEYQPDDFTVRMVADSHGTIWDTLFRVIPDAADSNRCELQVTMDCRAYKLRPRLMNPIMKGLYRTGLEKHVDAVAAYCQSEGDRNTSTSRDSEGSQRQHKTGHKNP